MLSLEANKLYLDGLVYKGTLRVNKNNRNVAYISVPEFHVDVCIQDDKYRNRALPGDEVFVELLPKEKLIRQTYILKIVLMLLLKY